MAKKPSPPKAEKLALTASTPQVTDLEITGVSPTTIDGNYNTLPGNQPSTYGNTIFIWQNQNQIPVGSPPLSSFSIPGNTQAGGYTFPGLNVGLNSYILGYATGPNVAQICSTAYLPAAGTASSATPFQTTLDPMPPTANSVTINYNTPAGNLPLTNGNWVGMWEGSVPSYTTTPKAKAQIQSDDAVGQAVINNYPFKRGTTYCIAYFMGTKQTTMAASNTFST